MRVDSLGLKPVLGIKPSKFKENQRKIMVCGIKHGSAAKPLTEINGDKCVNVV